MSINEAAPDKIRKYRDDYYSYRLIGKLTVILQLQEFSLHNQPWEDSFTFAARFYFCDQIKSKCGNILDKSVVLRINPKS